MGSLMLLRSINFQNAAPDLIFFDTFKQGAEIALAEPFVAFALNELKENRADEG